MAGNTCPIIPYGVSEDGSPEYNVNSGREIFRCGIGQNGCVKIYITNVSLEKSILKYSCHIAENITSDKFCLENITYTERLRTQVVWEAKENVKSDLPNGYVITRVSKCGDNEAIIPLYSEANIRVRSMLNIEDLSTELTDEIINTSKNNITGGQLKDEEFILQDISTNVSPTDWQTSNITFMAISNKTDLPYYTYRETINITNGRVNTSEGKEYYDDTDTPQPLADVIQYLLNKAG